MVRDSLNELIITFYKWTRTAVVFLKNPKAAFIMYATGGGGGGGGGVQRIFFFSGSFFYIPPKVHTNFHNPP